MTTQKLPWSEWSDASGAGSQSIPATPPNSYLARSRYLTRDRSASNDSSYAQEVHELMAKYNKDHQHLVVDSSQNSAATSEAINSFQLSAKQNSLSRNNTQTAGQSADKVNALNTFESEQNNEETEAGATIISFGYKRPASNIKFQRSTHLSHKKIAAITSMEDIQQLDEEALQLSDEAHQDKAIPEELSVDADRLAAVSVPFIEPQPEVSPWSYKKASKPSSKCTTTDKLATAITDPALTFQPLTTSLKVDLNDTNAPNHTPNKALTLAKNNNIQALPDTLPERVFMNSLMKHTLIALAIIVPLAAFTAYAATPNTPNMQSPAAGKAPLVTTQPNDIIYDKASQPTSVANVDLQKYSGVWFEIGRLPMRFQKKCQGDVTATYTPNPNGSITVLNQCLGDKGKTISATGQAKPVDDSGSKLKVSFLPSLIRWLPVGRVDYWVLARDDNYQTALVGTPNKK